jgi:hypothetical protein
MYVAVTARQQLSGGLPVRQLQRITPAAEMAKTIAAAAAAARKARMAGPIAEMISGSDVSEPQVPTNSGKHSSSNHPPLLRTCLLLDQGICNSSLQLSKAGQGFLVVAYNPLAFNYSWGLRIPVAKDPIGTITVLDPDGTVVPAQLLPMAETVAAWEGPGMTTDQEQLAFMVSLPALGHAVYKVLQHHEQTTQEAASSNARARVQSAPRARARKVGISYDSDEEDDSDDSTIAVVSDVLVWERQRSIIVSSDVLEVVLKPRLDGITQVRNLVTGAAWKYNHEIILYQGTGLGGSTAAAFGGPGAPRRAIVTSITFVKGPILQEIRQTFRDVGVLITRLWQGRDTLEVQWVVHNLPADQDWEVLLRYNTDIKPEHGVWFTDANGREWQQRRLNYRPSFNLQNLPQQQQQQHRQQHQQQQHRQSKEALGYNMYPVTTGVAIRSAQGAMSVATDRAQGVASLMVGSVEVLLHRSTATVSNQNINAWHWAEGSQQLEDPFPAIGTHILSFESYAKATPSAAQRRLLQQASSGPDQADQEDDESAEEGQAEAAAAAAEDFSSTEPHLFLHARHLQQILNDPIHTAFSALPKHRYRARSTGLKPAAVSAVADAGAAAVDGIVATDSSSSSSNVHVLTLQWVSCNKILLRLSHMFQSAEHETLAAPAQINLRQLLNIQIVKIQEAALFGNSWVAQQSRSSSSSSPRWSVTSSVTHWDPLPAAAAGPWYAFRAPASAAAAATAAGAGADAAGAASRSGSGPVVVLNPMEIRTFYITVQRRFTKCVDPPVFPICSPKPPPQVAFNKAARSLSEAAAAASSSQPSVPAAMSSAHLPEAAEAEAYQQQLLLLEGGDWDPNGVNEGLRGAAEAGNVGWGPVDLLLLLLRVAVLGLLGSGAWRVCKTTAHRAQAYSKRAD